MPQTTHSLRRHHLGAAISKHCPNSKTQTGRNNQLRAGAEDAAGVKGKLRLSTIANLVHSGWNGTNLRRELASLNPNPRAAFLVNVLETLKKSTKFPTTGSLLKMAVYKTTTKTHSKPKRATSLQLTLVDLLRQLQSRILGHSSARPRTSVPSSLTAQACHSALLSAGIQDRVLLTQQITHSTILWARTQTPIQIRLRLAQPRLKTTTKLLGLPASTAS
jgi:hypothetical protein